jgi:tetratricopeptide (TPR) repeat protein
VQRLPPATDGQIAVINLSSAREQSWNRFWRLPQRAGTAELIIEQEQFAAQFCGDLEAFDRMESLVSELTALEPEAAQTFLVAAQVACATHRFSEARNSLELAVAKGATADTTDRLALAIDQATGDDLCRVLAARRERAAKPGSWGELIPLGALLADLGEFDEAERIYLQALQEYPDVSPFALAWLCFQLGMLWGETAAETDPERAERWYRSAIDYLPGYVKARVHLAEILIDLERHADARALLEPVLQSGDPEVPWRLADEAASRGDGERATEHLRSAHRASNPCYQITCWHLLTTGRRFTLAAVVTPRARSTWQNLTWTTDLLYGPLNKRMQPL